MVLWRGHLSVMRSFVRVEPHGPESAGRPGRVAHRQSHPLGHEPPAHEQLDRLAERALPRAYRRAVRGLRAGCGNRGSLWRGRAKPVGLANGIAKPPQLVDDLVEPLALDELHGVEG